MKTNKRISIYLSNDNIIGLNINNNLKIEYFELWSGENPFSHEKKNEQKTSFADLYEIVY